MARFVAALIVVVYHLWRFDHWAVPAPVVHVVGAGPAAVSFFFVLSGFVLAWSQTTNDGALVREARAFWLRRLRRLVPMFLVAAVVAVPTAVGLIKRTFGEDVAVLPELLPELALHLSFMQAFVPGGELAINPPAWSLSAEMFFSLLFPLIAPAVLRATTSSTSSTGARPWVWLGLLWALSTLPGLAYLAVDPDMLQALGFVVDHKAHALWLDVLRYHPFVRLPEFVAGVVVCALVRQGFAPPRRSVWVAVVVMVSVSALGLPAPVTHNGLFLPCFVIVVAGLARTQDASTGVARALLLLGDASYALYLLHVPLLMWVAGLSMRGGGQNLLEDPVAAVVVVIAIVGASVVAHRVIEARFVSPSHTRSA